MGDTGCARFLHPAIRWWTERGVWPGPVDGTKFRAHIMMPLTQPPALLPLSLLEAVRNIDRPVEDGLEELSEEIVAKRLGLNPTVSAQITRYRGLVRQGRRVEPREVEAVFDLIARRPDAGLVYADAGRRAARYAVRSLAVPRRVLLRLMPPGVRRRLGAREAARLAGELFGASLSVGRLEADGEFSGRRPESGSCDFVGAALGELARLLVGFEGALVHRECRLEGATACRWHGEAAVPGNSF